MGMVGSVVSCGEIDNTLPSVAGSENGSRIAKILGLKGLKTSCFFVSLEVAFVGHLRASPLILLPSYAPK